MRLLWPRKCPLASGPPNEIPTHPYANKPLPKLGDAVIRRKKDAVLADVASVADALEEPLQHFPVLVSVRQAVDVLHKKRLWPRAAKQSDVLVQETRFRILARTLVFEPVARLREGRARWASD